MPVISKEELDRMQEICYEPKNEEVYEYLQGFTDAASEDWPRCIERIRELEESKAGLEKENHRLTLLIWGNMDKGCWRMKELEEEAESLEERLDEAEREARFWKGQFEIHCKKKNDPQF